MLQGNFNIRKHQHSFKPNGLWISWRGGWKKWCDAEIGSLDKSECLKARLYPGLKIWLIRNKKDFDEVWSKFSDEEPRQTILWADTDGKLNFWDWLEKHEKIDGIALTDAGQWKTRMSTFLYGWDCACVMMYNPKNVILSR